MKKVHTRTKRKMGISSHKGGAKALRARKLKRAAHRA